MGYLFDWKSIGSIYATLMFMRTAFQQLLPPEVYQLLRQFFSKFFRFVKQSNTISIQIDELGGGSNNEVYTSVQTYLSSKCFSSSSTNSLKLSRLRNSSKLNYSMVPNQTLTDIYEGITFTWSFKVSTTETSYNPEVDRVAKNRYLELSFDMKDKEFVHSDYIPYVLKEAETLEFKSRGKCLYSNREWSAHGGGSPWTQVLYFYHPSTFDSIAIDPVLKEEIICDLKKFVSRKDYYSRVGKSWKRGYLLYGPPGTGKTSLIAAIANFLGFDVYDIELTAVKNNSQLRKLLVATTSRSVIVIEDIDCSLDLSSRTPNKNVSTSVNNANASMDTTKNGSSTVSLSGVLNFVDGLWSSCAGERLIIFTTNHKDKLDPALLRPGRMDKHIHLSYCNFNAFKILVKNYLLIEEHEVMKEVEELLGMVKITPADVAELLIGCDEDPGLGLRNVVEELKKRLKFIKTGNIHEEIKKNLKLINVEDDTDGGGTTLRLGLA
ncbi:hypothetical protein MKX03_017967 [Papaver bracteatum]|nr:hypothetical protein MKX03_017967 [Papaver bracteatum]